MISRRKGILGSSDPSSGLSKRFKGLRGRYIVNEVSVAVEDRIACARVNDMRVVQLVVQCTRGCGRCWHRDCFAGETWSVVRNAFCNV